MIVITISRKPLIGSVALNILKYATAGINIDGCRLVGEVPVREQPIFNSPTGLLYGMASGKGR
ncbi:MAG: hypothetical protein WC824_15635, partial [Bacteroidota bacterium]